MRVLVAGAGGFIGGHLVADLLYQGHEVLAVDIKPGHEWYQIHEEAGNMANCDLSKIEECRRALSYDIDEVYMLAADMGGMGFIENNKLACMLTVLPSTNMLLASQEAYVKRYFYSSSACVYAADKQTDPRVTALKESDAYPAMAEDGYGWEKLFTERMCKHFTEETGMPTRVARFHNVYGPHGTWDGGREKAPAAICRKVIEAKYGDKTIDIWGDGNQTRSFMYISDCVEGIGRIMSSDYMDPLNLGSDELVSINQLVSVAEEIAGVELKRTYDLDAPTGVRGRNSDNTMLKLVTNWEPSVRLREGMEATYEWIFKEMMK